MKVLHTVLVITALCIGVTSDYLSAQSTAFVFGGGATIGTQKWDNSFSRQPLFAWHGTVAIESVNNEDDKSSLFVQLGYHVKGSAVRFWSTYNSADFFRTSERFKFNNVSLILGFKQKFNLGTGKSKYFYFGGIRGDYTVSTNLDELAEKNKGNNYASSIYPLEGGVKKLMGGISVGGGMQLPLTDLVGAELKVSLHPDFTLQYNSPPLVGVIVYNPYQPGQNTTIPERQIRNTTLEVSLCLRFLRKVIYEE